MTHTQTKFGLHMMSDQDNDRKLEVVEFFSLLKSRISAKNIDSAGHMLGSSYCCELAPVLYLFVLAYFKARTLVMEKRVVIILVLLWLKGYFQHLNSASSNLVKWVILIFYCFRILYHSNFDKSTSIFPNNDMFIFTSCDGNMIIIRTDASINQFTFSKFILGENVCNVIWYDKMCQLELRELQFYWQLSSMKVFNLNDGSKVFLFFNFFTVMSYRNLSVISS